MNPESVMIFAAGFGTRMGVLTADRPKPLIPVAGKALIDHALSVAAPRRTVVNAHYCADMLRDHLGADVKMSFEDPILETGGGLKAALPMLGAGPVFTLNSDAVWAGPNPLDILETAWRPEKMDALLLLIPRENAVGHSGNGDFINKNGVLTRGQGDVFTGAQIIKTDALSEIPDTVFSLNVLWDRMLAQSRVHGVAYAGKWCDVGTPQGINLAEDMLRGSHG